MEQRTDSTRPLHEARERLAREVRRALGQVPAEVAESAVGHAILAELLVQIAADILRRQGNLALLSEFVRMLHRRSAPLEVTAAGEQ